MDELFKREYNDAYDQDNLKGIYKLINVDFDRFESVLWKKNFTQWKEDHKTPLFEDVVNALHELYFFSQKNDLRFALHSANNWESYETQFKDAEIFDYFPVKIGAYNVEKHEIKPNPSSFNENN